ncbi:hypothetical protein LO772_16240 [Yinghuangia sp. ASG 101]|uniref:hypothetical protein n=1 Tax=Yinghuangia sp. ASG 101 TaxID=2896848 RepID=UPI001E61C263|nr:hypothetical protein [Yinghuangia sp. ASG 101]UGQ14977.1 hypothetical protein LO772_16240 [Yinghuangia sp. ASG 101]
MSTACSHTAPLTTAPRVGLAEGLRWFPLVARPRPVRGPAPQRLAELERLADEAARTRNILTACSVLNRSALFALDLGLPDLAAQWCAEHAETLLTVRPSPEPRAALEPVINLLRLRLRAEGSMDVVENAYESLGHREFKIGDLVVSPDFTTDVPAARQVLWMMMLEEGARLYAASGRWDDGYRFLVRHRGVGARMLDGRQLAVIAVAHDDVTGALCMLDATVSGHPTEDAVTAALTALISGVHNDAEQAAARFLALDLEPEHQVFRVRLGLAVLAALPDHATAAVVQADVTNTDDAIAAGDVINAGLGDDRLASLVTEAGLGCGVVPPELPAFVDRTRALLADLLELKRG